MPEKKKQKKSRDSIRLPLLVAIAAAVALGWCVGSIVPIGLFDHLREDLNVSTTGSSSTKYEQVLDIMTNDWFFADQIDDVQDRLVDQALSGMTTNSEDPHTEYMTKQEITDFTQMINRNLVGIGVEFRTLDSGIHIITRVLPDSPAEKAGVEVNDIIHAVDGKVVDGLTSTEIQDLVRGEEGTDVTIDFLRDGKTVTFTMTRAEVSSTTSYTVRDDGIGYLHILQFGNTTAKEVQDALDHFQDAGVTRILIDLRDNGGGYLEALQGVVDCFLAKDQVFLVREYSDGTKQEMKTDGGTYEGLGPIVLLVNENTASAAEAFTLAMKEGRDDVTIVGTTTYGKGTVQVTKYFDDGSAIKYTNSKWMSPSGVWVNNTGIAPDVEVKLPDILTSTYADFGEDESYAPDSVSDRVAEMEKCLQYLGYDVDRTDGYFSDAAEAALLQFASDHELESDGTLNQMMYNALLTDVVSLWLSDETRDTQLMKGIELLNGSEDTAAVRQRSARC